MDISELAELQKNVTEELMNQIEQLHDRINLEQRASHLMFGLVVAELEQRTPDIREQISEQLDAICAELDDPMTEVAANIVRERIS